MINFYFSDLIGRKQFMQGMDGDKCPFEFNTDPATFKVGDLVSYRIPSRFADFPFMGTLVAVHENYVDIASDPSKPADIVRGTRESRPLVADYSPT